jgi:hypothetical protein
MSAVVIASVCLGLLYVLRRSVTIDRRRRAQPVTRIADCQDGAQVKLVGKIVALKTFSAPQSGRACVAYSVLSHNGVDREVHDALQRFVVDDGSAQAIIDCGRGGSPIDLDLHPGPDGQRIFKRFRPERMPGLAGSAVGGTVQCEHLLVDGERVAVFGEVQLLTEPGTTGQSGYRDGSVSRVQLVPPRHGDFLVTATAYYVGG